MNKQEIQYYKLVVEKLNEIINKPLMFDDEWRYTEKLKTARRLIDEVLEGVADKEKEPEATEDNEAEESQLD